MRLHPYGAALVRQDSKGNASETRCSDLPNVISDVCALRIDRDRSCSGFLALTLLSHSLTPESGATALSEFPDWSVVSSQTQLASGPPASAYEHS